MQLSLKKLSVIIIINFLISIPTYAKMVEQKSIHFSIKPEELMKGDIHYHFSLDTPRKMAEKNPILFDLDSLSLLNEPQATLILVKSVFMVNKPIGFFDEKQMTDEKFISHVMGEQRISRISPDSFKVTVPGEFTHSYKMQIFFDADDLSTLPNSKIISAVSAAKKLDIISQGASTIMFTELTNFSKYSLGGIIASSYIPLKEDKTIIIQYHLKAVKKVYGTEKILKPGMIREISEVKKLIESYK